MTKKTDRRAQADCKTKQKRFGRICQNRYRGTHVVSCYGWLRCCPVRHIHCGWRRNPEQRCSI
nr:MAG TPA: hypothetical protein [Caudoviricetes sp.]